MSVVLKEFLQNPLVLSTAVGVLFLLFGVRLPAPINQGLHLLASTGTGVALFAMGLFTATMSWRHFKLRTAIVTSIIKLVIVPALALAACKMFGLTGTALAVTVLMAAMPSAIFCMVVATEYDYDERATADAILLSSVLFLITSPFWVRLVQ